MILSVPYVTAWDTFDWTCLWATRISASSSPVPVVWHPSSRDAMRALRRLETWRRSNVSHSTRSVPTAMACRAERQRNLRAAYQEAVSYAQRLQGWLLLMGGYGCGKTHLAAAIANDALSRGIVPSS